MVLLLTLVVNPPDPQVFVVIFLVAFFPALAIMAGILLTLAYPMNCWPGLIRTKRLKDLFGIKDDSVSKGRLLTWNWKSHGAYWAAFSKGAAVVLMFLAPVFLAAWAMGLRNFHSIHLMVIFMIVQAGNLTARAWIVSKLVAKQEEDSYFTSAI